MKKSISFIFWFLCFLGIAFLNYGTVFSQVTGLAFLCGLVDIVFFVFFVIWIDKKFVVKKTEPEVCTYDEGCTYQVDGCFDDYVKTK